VRGLLLRQAQASEVGAGGELVLVWVSVNKVKVGVLGDILLCLLLGFFFFGRPKRRAWPAACRSGGGWGCSPVVVWHQAVTKRIFPRVSMVEIGGAHLGGVSP
jgi:hypothetical protein